MAIEREVLKVGARPSLISGQQRPEIEVKRHVIPWKIIKRGNCQMIRRDKLVEID
jgi:hypothetical protein